MVDSPPKGVKYAHTRSERRRMVKDDKAWDLPVADSSKTYRALFTGDIHMNNALPHAKASGAIDEADLVYKFLSKPGLTDRMVDQRILWNKMRDLIRLEHLDALYVLGDLFDHGKTDVVTLNETAACIAEIAKLVPVYLLPGNHDAHSTEGVRFNLEALESLNVNVVCLRTYNGKSIIEPWARAVPSRFSHWLRFWPMEYMPVTATRIALAEFQNQMRMAVTGPNKQNILLIHNAINGCHHGDWMCDVGLEPKEVCLGFDRVLASHFHTHQTFGPDNEGMYLSAPMHHRFDDCGRDAFVWIGEFKQDIRPSFKPVKLHAPYFHQAEYEDDMSEVIGKLRTRDYLRIQVTATQPDWLGLQPALKELVDTLLEQGINASLMHKPIYHHKARIVTSSTSGKWTLASSIDDYVNSEFVDIGSLDKERLLQIGRGIAEKARMAKITEE